MLPLILCLAVTLVPLVARVEGGAVFELQLQSYSNPSGKEMDGDCCDSLLMCGSFPCDHDITFCLDDYRSSPDDHSINNINVCSLYKGRTGRLANSLVNYFQAWTGGVKNPIVIRKSAWPGRLVLKVHVLDHDAWKLVNKYSDVDKLYTILELPARHGIGQAPWISRSIRGVRSVSPTVLSFRMRAYCDPNFFGPKCDKYCFAQDHDTTGHFTCDPDTGDKICLPGWELPQTNCKVRGDDCAGNPCTRGICIDGNQQFSCLCPEGYTGYRCETDIDECASSPCVLENTVKCMNEEGGYRCVCKNGFSGINCDFSACADSDICSNGGTCVGDNECICAPGFSGRYCLKDDCDAIDCKNGGRCVRGKCLCPRQFTGDSCESPADPCRDVSCPYGTCIDGRCHNPCNGSPCQNRGTCFMSPDGGAYFCRCLPSFTGPNCQHAVQLNYTTTNNNDNDNDDDDGCSGVTCYNGGVCAAGSCLCPSGFQGDACRVPRDFCQGRTCQNGGTCFSNDRDYYCLCARGFEGKNCETSASGARRPCDGVTCLNGGTCDGGACACLDAFAGDRCERQTGCSPNPCLNNGKCYSNPYAYTCVCEEPWTGRNCDQRAGKMKAVETEKPEEKQYWIYILIGMGGALVLFLVILVVLLLRRASKSRRRRQSEAGHKNNNVRASFDNQTFRKDSVYENVVEKRRSSIDGRHQNNINQCPAGAGRPRLPDRSASYDGSVAESYTGHGTSARRSSEPATDSAKSTGFSYAKVEKSSKKTRDVRTPKNLEQKFLALKAYAEEGEPKI